MADRIIQVVAETSVELDDTTARINQVVVEVPVQLDDVTAQISQVVVESSIQLADATAQIAQVVIEVAILPGEPTPPSTDSRGGTICMPITTVDEIISQKHHRAFIQWDGSRPNNPMQYAGQDAQYFKIEGVSIPVTGGVDPIWVPDPNRVGQYRIVNRSITPPDLGNASLVFYERHGSLPRHLFKNNCPFNVYENIGTCKDLSDNLRGWSDYIAVYSGAIVTDKDLGDRMSWDSDDANEDSLSITLSDWFVIGPLSFGEEASTEISREVVDIVYASKTECGNCGPQNDGTKWIYAVTKSSGSGSPGLPAELVYSTDAGLTWTQTNIDNFGASEDPLAVDIVGQRIVVLGDGAYYYADLNQYTGAPGTFTKVTTGFNSSHDPQDIYVLSPREIFFCAADGWIYKSDDITGGVSVINNGVATSNTLYRIHGRDQTIVAVGAGSTVVKSINRGATWTTTTDNPADIALDVKAVSVLDHLRYWVGTADSGRLYYTLNGGETWVQKEFSGAGSGTIHDIIFANDEVGWFSHSTSSPVARVFSTWNGGQAWTRDTPRILNWPVFDKANRLSYPDVDDKSISANYLAIGGLAGDGSDGVIYVGQANRL